MKTEHTLKKLAYIFALSLCVLMIVLFIKSEPREAVFALFLAVLVHEAGHIAALFLAGESIKGALFLPFGVLLRARFSCSYLCEALIYLAGPAASIISALAAFLFVKSAPSPSFALYYFVVSLGLGLFNLCLLPGLDGRCALGAVLLCFCDDIGRVNSILRALEGVFCALFFLFFGGVWLATGELSYPMLMGVLFIIRYICG